MNFFAKIKMVLTDATLRNRILFVLGALALFRLLANIPIPAAAGGSAAGLLAENNALGFFNVLTGGGLSAVSLMMLGVGPYITASIIMQLSTMMSSRLKAMYHEEGEMGRRRFTQYSRLLTVPLAIIQGYALLVYLKTQGMLGAISGTDMIINTAIIVGGAVLIMWIGELISEFGIGNGTSLVIFAGIVAGLPALIAQNLFKFDVSQIPLYLGFLITSIIIILGVVIVTEAERPIPITYAKRVRGMKVYGGTSTYLPLRINQAGVIPIIFALSILVFPQMLVSVLSGAENETVRNIAQGISSFIGNQWVNGILYFSLVFLFTFFYTAVTFEPESVATNLQKNGAFIPGVRPGKSTAEYLAKVLTRITLVGAIFLGFVAVLPFVMQSITGTTSLAIGGTALLIVVSVVTDLIKKIDAQISMREY
ncbi:MAG: preprotein translocase subunit SecY [Candidatus Yonathbacteria bacterium RIFOXYC1_FULL_52_10]|uniref:Protein translocase subunit SecY n=1 Tax=Candidatus Yonathbacteria bacterium RIFOXYD1_FULL_52_36 TaxID=1802730 RepID=A0A1G2SIK0_9BACT|nr:MAG: preprotein translocase subunit SecY [Candidatus Yonathbacteria bacterium RIFOXYC1_FULL_52_10]OHA84865.1 MAG: preprotein translocase subunit SecY [Candidatus Yonathbacteria bacterium RIFOXYD1_FULL_52_36]